MNEHNEEPCGTIEIGGAERVTDGPDGRLWIVHNPEQAQWLAHHGAVASPLGDVFRVPMFEDNPYTTFLLDCLKTSHPEQTRQKREKAAFDRQITRYRRMAQARVTVGVWKSLFLDPDHVKSRKACIGDEDYDRDRSEWWNPENLPDDAPGWPDAWDDEQAGDDDGFPVPTDWLSTLYWIDPYPSYQAELDDPWVAIQAVWRLYCQERWNLLAYLGLDPELDGDALDACFPDDLALYVAALGCGLAPGPVSRLSEDMMVRLHQGCPRFLEAARLALKDYRKKTWASTRHRRAGERRWQRFMSRLRDRGDPPGLSFWPDCEP